MPNGKRMQFEFSVDIGCTPDEAFQLLQNKHEHPQEPGSAVLSRDKTTDGPVDVGTRYRERIRMLPGLHGVLLSTVTRCEPWRRLEEDFEGAGVKGHLSYELSERPFGCRLIQRQTVEPAAILRPLVPLMRRMFASRLEQQLAGVKAVLETGTATLRPWPLARRRS